jgi:hypothetical protein
MILQEKFETPVWQRDPGARMVAAAGRLESMIRFIAGVVVLVFAAAAPAQSCSNVFSMTFTEYGAGCSAFGQDAPALSGAYDPSACVVALSLSGWSGNCPNICLSARLLAIGAAPQQVALPFAGCDLLVVPDLVFAFAPAVGPTIVLGVPNVPLAGATLYVQGAHDFLWGATHAYELSNGLQVSIL